MMVPDQHAHCCCKCHTLLLLHCRWQPWRLRLLHLVFLVVVLLLVLKCLLPLCDDTVGAGAGVSEAGDPGELVLLLPGHQLQQPV